jgi:hypothetical protein
MNRGRAAHLTPVAEKEFVLVPWSSAETFLRTSFSARSGPARATARIVLPAGNVPYPLSIRVERVRPPDDPAPRFAIHWEAGSDGPYPEFDGELSVSVDVDLNGFWIVLTGAYAPPGGAAGQIFDVALGSRIAKSTARALLRRMRDEIEAFDRSPMHSKAS